jgi:hypothetical protein
VSEEYELFFYCETSGRTLLLPATWLDHSVVRTTDDEMLKYLTHTQYQGLVGQHFTPLWDTSNNTPVSGEQDSTGKGTGSLGGLRRVCRVHIAPQGVQLWPCYCDCMPNTSVIASINQLNLILIREFGSSLCNELDDQLSLISTNRMEYDNSECTSNELSLNYCCFLS